MRGYQMVWGGTAHQTGLYPTFREALSSWRAGAHRREPAPDHVLYGRSR